MYRSRPTHVSEHTVGMPDLDARVAEGALLGLAGLVVEVDLLVGAAGDAHAPATAAVLVDQDDAVLGSLVHGTGGARGNARRVEAVLADAGQVEHEGLLELERDSGRPPGREILTSTGSCGDQVGAAAEVVVPVGRPLDLHRLAGDQRLRLGDRGVLAERCGDQRVVLVRPRLVVVGQARQLGVGEDRGELLEPTASLEPESTTAGAFPPASPDVSWSS